VRADVVVLPNFIELELRGVPVHTWEQSTVHHILSGSCLVKSLHIDMTVRMDLSVFHVCAWCQRPELIPSAVAMFIPDPVIIGAEQQQKGGTLLPCLHLHRGWGHVWTSAPFFFSSRTGSG
jgi:hypothetical protein